MSNDKLGSAGEKPKSGAIKTFFMVVGIAFMIFVFCIAAIIAYIAIAKPFGIDVTNILEMIKQQDGTAPSYDHPLLDTQQESILESLGVDLESVPSAISPEQEDCAVEALGQDRVDEIKGGATPGVTDLFKARHCFE